MWEVLGLGAVGLDFALELVPLKEITGDECQLFDGASCGCVHEEGALFFDVKLFFHSLVDKTVWALP